MRTDKRAICIVVLLAAVGCSEASKNRADTVSMDTGELDVAPDLVADAESDAADGVDAARLEDSVEVNDSDDAVTWTCARTTLYTEPPSCGSGVYDFQTLVPGPGEAAFDGVLADRATRFQRQHELITGHNLHVHIEARVEDPANREIIRGFLQDTESWDFETTTGMAVTDVVTDWGKAAGAYSGVGIAADAYRYGVLRDQGADCTEVDRARDQVQRALDTLHLATEITGVEGVIARGFARTDVAGHGQSVTPVDLFDASGNPLPEEKNNGTWRVDQSGNYPNYVWEDSCSRDQYIGWATGFGALWEVIRDDPSFSDADKLRIQADAAALARSLMLVGDRGYDLEIRDADGRITYHGFMHEHAFDRAYIDILENGSHTIMTLGILSALAYVAEDDEIDAFIYQELLDEREYARISHDANYMAEMVVGLNFSSYNMVFLGSHLAAHYLCDDSAGSRDSLRATFFETIYDPPGKTTRSPVEMKQSLFDFTHAASHADNNAWRAGLEPVDGGALGRGLETLTEYYEPPSFEIPRINCDDAEIAAGTCEALDGTMLELLGYVGRGDKLVSAEPVPMRTRPPSNYYWRSNPYQVNGSGDESRLVPATDWRYPYWLGRWTRVSP